MVNPDQHQTKRDFLKYFLSGGVFALFAAIIYPILAYLKPPKVTGEEVTSVSIGKADQFPVDSGTIFRFGNKPGILIHTKQGEFRAFSAVCTHLDCTVQYKKEAGLMWCACHNGQYDLTGRNVSGPPPKPLTPFKVIQKGNEIFITRT